MSRAALASSLTVESVGPGAWRITGGAAPHRVEIFRDVARCDCKGFQYRTRCRHLDAVGEYLRVAPLDAAPGPFDDGPLLDQPPAEDRADEPPALEGDPFAKETAPTPAPDGPALDQDVPPPDVVDSPPAIAADTAAGGAAVETSARAPDPLGAAIERDTRRVLDRCDATLTRLEADLAVPDRDAAIMRRWTAARERAAVAHASVL